MTIKIEIEERAQSQSAISTGPPPEPENETAAPEANRESGGSAAVAWGSDIDRVGSGSKYPGLLPASSNVIRGELIGADIAIASGIAVNGEAPALKLCRSLIEAGIDPATRLELYRGEVLCLIVRSIGEGARLTVREDGMRFVAYRLGPSRRARKGAGGSSPIAQTEGAATPIAEEPECP